MARTDQKKGDKLTSRMMDISGDRYGKLVVVEFEEKDGKQSLWKCVCDCGSKHVVSIKNLRSGSTVSCGCKRKEFLDSKRKEYGESSFNQLYQNYKKRALDKKMQFLLTKEEFKKITKEDCFYCGIKPKQKQNNKSGYGYYIYNGVDRINNNLGYTLSNTVACCKHCNTMKMDLTLKDFTERVSRIYHRMVLNGEN